MEVGTCSALVVVRGLGAEVAHDAPENRGAAPIRFGSVGLLLGEGGALVSSALVRRRLLALVHYAPPFGISLRIGKHLHGH